MSTKPRVLIAEDDPAFRRVLNFTLDRSGCETVCTASGEAAWEQLAKGDFQCLVTDHQMPGMSGIDLIQQIRNDLPCGRQLKIILCTAKGLELDTNSLIREYHLARVMHKPFSPRQLAEAVTDSLTDTTDNNPSASNPC